MIYLSGHYSERIARVHPNLGFMVTPDTSYRLPDGVTWAADNACFNRPQAFDFGRYLIWLDARREQLPWCLFAPAPDVVGDAAATLDRFADTGRAIRDLGYPVALVGQDGLEHLADQIPWGDFDALFIGGSTRWKLSEPAYRLAVEAKRRGKWTHMGRVNGWPRFRAAAVSGFDSADGTKLAFGPDANLPIVLSWLDRATNQARMFEVSA